MEVVVLGAGVVGVASAYYLAQAGHAVTVIDRQSAPGLETSFANAGQVSPGLSAPWAAPGVPGKALRGMLKRHSAFLMRPGLDPALWRWLRLMLANCNDAAYQRNKSRMLRLAEYSRDCLADLRDATGLAYEGQQRGLLQLFRTQAQLDRLRQDTEVLARSGIPFEVLDQAGCAAREPALARVPGKIAGGLLLPGDETGDAFLFTQALARLAEAQGVGFRFDTDIRGLRREGDRIVGVETEAGLVRAERYVVCLGSYSARLVRDLGIDLPVYPVKGYSLTIPVADPGGAPASTVLDETYKVAITRLGERIRVGGLAELAGFDRSLRPARRATLAFAVSDLYPDGGDPARGTFWTGLRPMTPDGTPVVGGTRYPNLFLNTGHGTLGWTMSCGSGRLVADLVSDRRPNIPHEDLALSRYAA